MHARRRPPGPEDERPVGARDLDRGAAERSSAASASTLSPLESDALRLYLEGSSYEEMADELECDTKTIDNALQRVKRKILNHQRERQVLS